MKKYIALLQIFTLLLLWVPQLVSAQNEGVNGTVDVRIMAHATSTSPFEYIGIRFTTTGELPLDMTGFTISDEVGVQYTFSTFLLEGESEVLLCQNNAPAVASGICDLFLSGGSVWNNDNDTFILRDQDGLDLFILPYTNPGAETEVVGTFEVDYPVPVVAHIVIENPPEDDLVYNEVEQFVTIYTDDDDTNGEVLDWLIRRDDCENGPIVMSSTTVATSTYAYSAPQLSVDVDTTVLPNGQYCFVVARVVPDDRDNLRTYRKFVVARYTEPLYRVSGRIYEDVNGNGRYEESVDTPIPDRLVTMQRVGEMDFLATTTDSTGMYQFDTEAGEWVVHDVLPTEWLQTAVFDGSEVVYSAPWAMATTSPVACSALLVPTDVDGAIVSQSCDFLSTRKGGKESTTDNPRSHGDGTKVALPKTPTPKVLGVGTSTASCGRYLSSYLGPQWANAAFEVQKLQLFLTAEGWYTPLTGRYDEQTIAHVKALQNRERETILRPWLLASLSDALTPTGVVYKTTRAYINNKICAGSDTYTLP